MDDFFVQKILNLEQRIDELEQYIFQLEFGIKNGEVRIPYGGDYLIGSVIIHDDEWIRRMDEHFKELGLR